MNGLNASRLRDAGGFGHDIRSTLVGFNNEKGVFGANDLPHLHQDFRNRRRRRRIGGDLRHEDVKRRLRSRGGDGACGKSWRNWACACHVRPISGGSKIGC